MADQLGALDLDALERRALSWPGNNLQPEIHVLVRQFREVEAGFNATNEALSAAETRIAQLERVLRRLIDAASNPDDIGAAVDAALGELRLTETADAAPKAGS